MGQDISIDVTDKGVMDAYLATSINPGKTGIVLAMTIFGVNRDLRSVADHYAALGFTTIVPNLFWRTAPGHALEPSPAASEFSRAQLDGYDDLDGIDDLLMTARRLRAVHGCEHIAIIGWCFGGRLAVLCASSGEIGAVAALYPTWLETRLDVVADLRCPVSLHQPRNERFATRPDALELIVEAFQGNENEVFVYEGVTHGFDGGPNYDRDSSRLAHARIARFLQRALN